MKKLLIPIYLLLIFGTPAVLTGAPLLLAYPVWAKLTYLLLAPLVFSFSFVLVAGLLSKPHQNGIVAGRFPRDMNHPVYGHRKLYGVCWTAVYYFKPVYFIFLSVPVLQTFLFRLFGYKGNTDFTVYPDTWIRDLPLLDIGKGAYLSNRATLGTNIVMKDGRILVGEIRIGPGTIVGHLSASSPGATYGANVQIGAGTLIGMKVHLADGVDIGAGTVIDHGCSLESGVRVNTRAYIGTRSIIGANAVIPAGAVLAPRSVIEKAEAAE